MKVYTKPYSRTNLRIVMWVARVLDVPIDVHGSFFRRGKKDLNTAMSLTGPKTVADLSAGSNTSTKSCSALRPETTCLANS